MNLIYRHYISKEKRNYSIKTHHNNIKRHIKVNNSFNVDMLGENGSLARGSWETVKKERTTLGNFGQNQLGNKLIGNQLKLAIVKYFVNFKYLSLVDICLGLFAKFGALLNLGSQQIARRSVLHFGKGGNDTTGDSTLTRSGWTHNDSAELVGK